MNKNDNEHHNTVIISHILLFFLSPHLFLSIAPPPLAAVGIFLFFGVHEYSTITATEAPLFPLLLAARLEENFEADLQRLPDPSRQLKDSL